MQCVVLFGREICAIGHAVSVCLIVFFKQKQMFFPKQEKNENNNLLSRENVCP